MRPSDLNPLFATAAGLKGIGPKRATLLDRLVGRGDAPARAIDLLFHLPVGTVDRRARPKIAEAPRDAVVVIGARVVRHIPAGGRGKAPHKVIVEDETGDVTLVFFLNNNAWVEKALPVGAVRWVTGRLELYDGRLQMVHPDRVMDEAALRAMPAVEPVYGLTEGLFPRVLAGAIDDALGRLPALPEWQEPARLARHGWPDFPAALRLLHAPDRPEALDPQAPAVERLSYDELLAGQLALALIRASVRGEGGRATLGTGERSRRVLDALPFRLTAGQEAALGEIRDDMGSESRMLRLLQGDVGSGKTIVALLAMVTAAEAGRQAALMAPTEILVRQHYERIEPLARAAGLSVALLTGRDKPAERAATLEALGRGRLDLVIGTHALFGEQVRFADLALVVVDEQHRFGVAQRLALASKGSAADLLLMTATPIPRTLVMTLFGDMDVSALRDKPAGREPIRTGALPVERLGEVLDRLDAALASGARAYWVCPLVAESEVVDLVAVTDRFAALRSRFGERVALVHGQMPGPERDAAVTRFARGDATVLVATTVIEVGVDVPDASIMVIEHAERFGLSQLHQLRGRVGRGRARSSCLLLYKGPLGEVSRARLDTLRDTEDGFLIAERDLQLRGEGELTGTRQSGLPAFRIARLEHHGPLLAEAREEAARLAADPALFDTPRGAALRRLLYLFDRDDGVRLMGAG